MCWWRILTQLVSVLVALSGVSAWASVPTPPESPVKLIFIHHSTGGNWLADPNDEQPYGGLGAALRNNNYFVSATNYGWGPHGIGDRTDIPNWPEWFRGENSEEILRALYDETGQNIEGYGWWPRLAADPGGENQVVMFKSCFPNSDLFGSPDEASGLEPNDQYTVANAKAVYLDLLKYFRTRLNKLFVVITAPPQNRNDYGEDVQTPEERASNARALNNWLVHDWLTDYPYLNVAVFDYYNVLTAANNHHRWQDGRIQHAVNTNNNFSAYPAGEADSHPSTTGQQKATSEFIPLLNYFLARFMGQVGCLSFGPGYSIAVPCFQLAESRLGFTFDYVRDLYWEINVATVSAGAGESCLGFKTDYSIPVPCFLLGDTRLRFVFSYAGELDWLLDLKTVEIIGNGP